MLWNSAATKGKPKAHIEGVKAHIEGVDDKVLISLYNTGRLSLLKAGEPLFKEGEDGRSVYLITNGKIEVRESSDGPDSDVFTAGEGDWLGEAAFSRARKTLTTAVALTSATVLALDESEFNILEPGIQRFILQRINDMLMQRMLRASKSLVEARERNQYVAKGVMEMIERGAHCEHSDFITTVLKSIPILPVHTARIIHLLLRERGTARELALLAKEDPSLVSQILRVVNSAYYNLPTKVSDIQYAITFLGFNQIYQIVVSSGLSKCMPKSSEFQELHDHSMIISNLVYQLCQQFNKSMSTSMTTIAILHDIGKSLSLFLKKQNPKISFLIDLLDPSVLGSMLLKTWNIPEKIHGAVKYQGYPEFFPPSEIPFEHRRSVGLLYLAHAMCEYIKGGAQDGIVRSPFLRDYTNLISPSGFSMQAFVEKNVLSQLQVRAEALPQPVREFLLAGKFAKPA